MILTMDMVFKYLPFLGMVFKYLPFQAKFCNPPPRECGSSPCLRIAVSATGAMAESAPLIEDEFAQRDDMGLQQLTEKTETEDQSFAKYVPWTPLKQRIGGMQLVAKHACV